ncbi:p24 complex component [Physocladia obscura]|uniref:P24 complex component n=1 Tax=Physocladia obscura TaxID=109957 RepID=A0AAD5T5Y7_9FUNG|nr:p24 complex component [Physocladia obscura]
MTAWVFALVLALVLAAVAVRGSNNFHLTLEARTRQCFHETLAVGDQLGLSYQVFGNGAGTATNLDIDVRVPPPFAPFPFRPLFLSAPFSLLTNASSCPQFWVAAPDGTVAAADKLNGVSGSLLHTARVAGRAEFCLSNMGWGGPEKYVSFAVNGPDEQRRTDAKSSTAKESVSPAKDSLSKELDELHNVVQQVADEQAYIRSRLLRHHATAESTNSRVLHWTFLEASIIASVIAFQIKYITHFFQNTSRRMV